jgi:hypothetical protein
LITSSCVLRIFCAISLPTTPGAGRFATPIATMAGSRPQIVVGTEGRCVHPAFPIQTGNQGDWPRRDQAYQEVVSCALGDFGKIEVHATQSGINLGPCTCTSELKHVPSFEGGRVGRVPPLFRSNQKRPPIEKRMETAVDRINV